ncbi:MAG: HEPN domain-containing protein [Euryarchaeota archaeon]|nr:HEPN domain-containing protein [Euryarchaeota archaeon]
MTWFEKSRSFKKNVENALKMELYDIACFSSQQAVELYLKGKIIAKSGSKPYTHSLVELLRIIEKLGYEVPEDVMKCAKELGEHYTQARYPDARITEYEKEDAEKAIRCMEEILEYAEVL